MGLMIPILAAFFVIMCSISAVRLIDAAFRLPPKIIASNPHLIAALQAAYQAGIEVWNPMTFVGDPAEEDELILASRAAYDDTLKACTAALKAQLVAPPKPSDALQSVTGRHTTKPPHPGHCRGCDKKISVHMANGYCVDCAPYSCPGCGSSSKPKESDWNDFEPYCRVCGYEPGNKLIDDKLIEDWFEHAQRQALY